MNGSRLIAGCFRFIFGSRYAESTHSKFGVLAHSRDRHSRINTVTIETEGMSQIEHRSKLYSSNNFSRRP